MALDVRPIRATEVADFARSVTVPFLEDASDAAVEHWTPFVEPDRAWVAEDHGRFVANACIFTRTATLPAPPGTPCPHVPMAAISAVGVHPTHRRRGVLRALMDEMLADARRRGETIAGLKASEGGIYGRFGFGLATNVVSWRIDPKRSSFLAPPEPIEVRLVTPDEAGKRLPAMHARFCQRRAGEVSRGEAYWTQSVADRPDGRDGGTAMFYAVAGDDLGYAAYRAHDTSEGVFYGARIAVKEVYGASDETEAALWRFVFDLDLAREVVGRRRPVDDPLRWRLADPRQLRVTAVEDLLWVRILDVAGALGARGYGVDGGLTFEVTDGDDAVRGSWVLEAGPDGASCRRASPSDEPGLACGIADLGSLYLGGVAPSALAAAGRLRAADPDVLRVADSLFTTPRAPFSGTSF